MLATAPNSRSKHPEIWGSDPSRFLFLRVNFPQCYREVAEFLDLGFSSCVNPCSVNWLYRDRDRG